MLLRLFCSGSEYQESAIYGLVGVEEEHSFFLVKILKGQWSEYYITLIFSSSQILCVYSYMRPMCYYPWDDNGHHAIGIILSSFFLLTCCCTTS